MAVATTAAATAAAAAGSLLAATGDLVVMARAGSLRGGL
jgi:hypothetical protein